MGLAASSAELATSWGVEGFPGHVLEAPPVIMWNLEGVFAGICKCGCAFHVPGIWAFGLC